VVGNPENIAALVLLALVLSSGARARITGLAYAILAIVILACMSTVVGWLTIGSSYSINLRAFGPFLRVAVCFQALRCADNPAVLQGRLLWLGASSSVFAILQYLSPTVAAFTSAHYLAAERSAAFTHDFSGDSIVRVIGFFENPSSVALLSIVLILLTIQAFSVGRLGRKALLLFVALHLAAGILSMSKIFFAGLPLVLIQLFLLRYRLAAFSMALAAAIGVILILNTSNPLVDVVRYAFNATLDPDIALKGRYLDEQVAVLMQSPFFGYGLVAVDDVNINDSAYLVTGYLFGALGTFVIAALLSGWLWRRRETLHASHYLVLAIILVAGVGANSLLGFRVDIFLTALCALLFIEPHARSEEK